MLLVVRLLLRGFWAVIRSVFVWMFRQFVSQDPAERIETAFLGAFKLALLLVIGALLTLWAGWWQLFGGDLNPEFQLVDRGTSSTELAELLRNLSFTVAGAVGALFGLFQLHNAARRTRISDDEAATSFQQERNERFVSIANLLASSNPVNQLSGMVAMRKLGL